MDGIFIIGTDTGVGKTFFAVALIKKMREKGIRVSAMKPFECGQTTPSDSERLWQATGPPSKTIPQYVCPYPLDLPLAPAQAAAQMKQKISLQRIQRAFRKGQKEGDFLIVEGCGGLLVPLLPQDPFYTIEDLALDFGLAVLLVARAGLGTLNHTLLTVHRCQQVGLPLMGIVLNQERPSTAENDPSLSFNLNTLENLCSIPVWGPLPYQSSPSPDEELSSHLEEIFFHIQSGFHVSPRSSLRAGQG